MTRLVAFALALLVTAGCAGAGHGTAARLHRHYFEAGKRACKHLVKRTQSSVTISTVDLSSYPAGYRNDVARGCAADR